jgi:transcriptional regulator with XRE-family HTH domain
MFDVKKFGAYLSKLRKAKDMTQSELSDMLNVTRQAVSKWENGDSFPDISILTMIASIFCISIDKLINAGETQIGESAILTQIAIGNVSAVTDMIENKQTTAQDIVNVAPFLKASTLDIIADVLAKHGIDISQITALVEYMNDNSITKLLDNANFENINEEMLTKFIPFLDSASKEVVFAKILSGELDISLIRAMLPYMNIEFYSLVEAAVVEGQLDEQALVILHEYFWKE